MLPQLQSRSFARLSTIGFSASRLARNTRVFPNTSIAARLCTASAPIPAALKRKYNYDGQETVQLPRDLEGDRVSIKAFYLGRSIDIVKAFQDVYGSSNHIFHSKSVLATIDEAKHQHVAVFKYGSVVFFNVDDDEQQAQLRRLKQLTQSPVGEGLGHAEDFTLVVSPSMPDPSEFRPAYLMLQKLDRHNLSIVSTVMAQTVALDHYTVAVDRMLDTFIDINDNIERAGQFHAGEKRRLFKLIASNSTIITDVLSKLGIFDKSDTAWKYADYTPAWDGLREEFEVEERFKHLEYKLELMKDNTRFFLDMLHNQKSNNLEVVIIVLIAAEIALGLVDFFHLSPFK